LLIIVSRIRKNFSANIDRTCQANESVVLRSFGLEWIFIGRLPFDGALTLVSSRYKSVSARQDADKRRTNLQGKWTTDSMRGTRDGLSALRNPSIPRAGMDFTETP
jgi:hypothetical protein